MSRIRLNIVDLKKNHAEQFGRFVMALKNLEDSDDWYRICGIHGNTFRPDDAEVRCPTDPNIVKFVAETGEPVYCKHSVYSFIAWHTPYLYQFELLLNKYNRSGNEDYIALPYIDLTESADFAFMNDPTITIFYEKKRITIDNPLAGAYYYTNGVKTRTSRNGFLTPRTEKERKQLHTVKHQLNNVMYAPVYELFSSKPVSFAKTGEITKYTPLETPHNSIHDIIGGEGGTMSDISISAFDPIFWLHHCNMDRHFYSWVHANTGGFKESLYPAKITKPI
jgi:tyrosinase